MKMVMILVFCEHLFKKANANPNQAKSTARLVCRTVTEEILAQKSMLSAIA
jgi:hypothetical protein